MLYSSSRDGNSNIYLMEGLYNHKPITTTALEEWSPRWYSNHEITFLRQEGKQITVVLLDLLTNVETKLPHPQNCVIDDKNIVYSPIQKRQLYTCDGNVYVIDSSMTEPLNLTAELDGTANYAEWVTEDQICFTSNHEGNNEVYLYSIIDDELTNLSQHPANDERGDISPNGRYVVFSSNRFESGNQDIVMLDMKTKNTTNISRSRGTELIARWSKNSKGIYFGSNKDGNWEIYYYQLADGKKIRLTTDDAFDGDPRIFD